MKIENKKIYRCDFCSKYYIHKGHIEKHENYCRYNPKNQHKCFEFCQHLIRKRIDISESNSFRVDITVFECKYYENDELYSYQAEKRNLDVIKDGIRMPLQCEYYEEMRR